jgi:hypothetical protein
MGGGRKCTTLVLNKIIYGSIHTKRHTRSNKYLFLLNTFIIVCTVDITARGMQESVYRNVRIEGENSILGVGVLK